MPNTDLDYFDIAKKLTRAHSEALGDVYLKNTELGIAREVVQVLVDRIIFMAQTIHLTHYVPGEGQWTECKRPNCRDTAELISSLAAGVAP